MIALTVIIVLVCAVVVYLIFECRERKQESEKKKKETAVKDEAVKLADEIEADLEDILADQKYAALSKKKKIEDVAFGDDSGRYTTPQNIYLWKSNECICMVTDAEWIKSYFLKKAEERIRLDSPLQNPEYYRAIWEKDDNAKPQVILLPIDAITNITIVAVDGKYAVIKYNDENIEREIHIINGFVPVYSELRKLIPEKEADPEAEERKLWIVDFNEKNKKELAYRTEIENRRKRKEAIAAALQRAQAASSVNNNPAPWDTQYYNHPCPYCGAYKVRPAKWEDKRLSIAFWGPLASPKTGARFKCENCNRMW